MKIKILIFAAILFLILGPQLVFAQNGLVTCTENCTFLDFVDMINGIIDFVFKYLALPIAALMFAYAGFTLVTSGGSSEARSKAKNIFSDAIIGIILAAGAWLIIKTLLSILGYKDVGLFF